MDRIRLSAALLLISVAQSAFAQSGAVTARPAPESVYVERLTLTDVSDKAGPGLNVGAVVASKDFAAGIQKAADVWGINLDIFIEPKLQVRRQLVDRLIAASEAAIMIEAIQGEQWYPVAMEAGARGVVITTYGPRARPLGFQDGWDSFKTVRAGLVAKIPKYEEILPIAFPTSPLPDNFFRPSNLTYPKPLLRVQRTEDPLSAISPFQSACIVVEQTGNLLYPGSTKEADILTMNLEGGGLSLKALEGSLEPERLAAVATAQTVDIGGVRSDKREITTENDATGPSRFVPAIHAPEELEAALAAWVAAGKITSFARTSSDEVVVKGWDRADRRMRAGLFVVSSEPASSTGPIPGHDDAGRRTLDFQAKDGLWQQLVEVADGQPSRQIPAGGPLTARGAQTGSLVGHPLRSSLLSAGKAGKPQPYVLLLEGGFLAVTPERPVLSQDLTSSVRSVALSIRGPLSSDQTITISLENNRQIVLRRTVLDSAQLNRSLGELQAQGLVQGWRYEGARGRGINANVVLLDFLGKHRRFMSSLVVTPTRPSEPGMRFYVDGMQRLCFSLDTPQGWRQQFVEVPMRVPPVPRDIELNSGGEVANR